MGTLLEESRSWGIFKMLAIKFIALFAVAVFAAEEKPFDGDKVYRIVPKTDGQLSALVEYLQGTEGLDVWAEPSQVGQNVDVHVPAKQTEEFEGFLNSIGVEYSLMIDNLEVALEEEEASNLQYWWGEFDYYRYNTYDDIAAELKRLSEDYPQNAQLFYPGRSYERRQLVGIKITDGSKMRKPAVWIDGGIHAREWISPATVMYFMNKLLEGSDPRTGPLLQKYDMYFLPVFNVDGYVYTHTSRRNRLWRKTRSQGAHPYCYGADPNRNWGYRWQNGVGTSDDPCSDIFRGLKAFSEIEVKQVSDYLMTIPDLKSYYNVHAYSQLVLTPWSYTIRYPNDYAEIKRVADVFVRNVARRYRTYYRAGPPSRVLYAVAGGSIDWTYAVLRVKYSYALELRDRGRYGFVLPASQIKPSGEETSDAFYAAIMAMK